VGVNFLVNLLMICCSPSDGEKRIVDDEKVRRLGRADWRLKRRENMVENWSGGSDHVQLRKKTASQGPCLSLMLIHMPLHLGGQ